MDFSKITCKVTPPVVTYYGERRQAGVIWDTRKHCVFRVDLPFKKGKLDLFTCLHEYAHIALGMPAFMGISDDGDEIAASRLALQWIKPALQASALRYYVGCIARGCTKKYRRWIIEQLICEERGVTWTG